MRVYLFIAAIAGGATFLLTPLIRHLAIQIGAVGKVRARDVHTIPTPRMGGLAMMLGFAVAMLFASHIPFVSGLFQNNHQAWVVLAGAVALQIISLPIGSLFAASPTLSIAITAFLIVVSINAVNFVDGLDGLASGIVAIGGIAFAIYSYIIARSSPSYASMATLIDVAMVGICVGFILHNWHPAKLFMGDSGSMLLGYLITCASIIMTGRLDPASIHTSIYLPVFMPILLPMCMAIVRRLRKGQSPMHPDRMHLHHRMLKIGHSVQGAVLILWGWAALISFGSIMILFFPARFVAIGFAMAVVLLTVATMYPYLKHRIPELRAENARLEAARRAAAAGGPKASDGDGDGASAGVGTGDKAGVSD